MENYSSEEFSGRLFISYSLSCTISADRGFCKEGVDHSCNFCAVCVFCSVYVFALNEETFGNCPFNVCLCPVGNYCFFAELCGCFSDGDALEFSISVDDCCKLLSCNSLLRCECAVFVTLYYSYGCCPFNSCCVPFAFFYVGECACCFNFGFAFESVKYCYYCSSVEFVFGRELCFACSVPSL